MRRLLLLLPLLLLACTPRDPVPVGQEGAAPPPRSGGAAPTPPPARPRLDREPTVGVLLLDGPRVSVTLRGPGEAGGRRFPPGATAIEAAGGRIRMAGIDLGPGPVDVRIAPDANGARFACTAVAPIAPFKREVLTLGGDLRLALHGGEVQVIELVPLERYLAGVLTVEMSPSYPAAALQAQAIAARSYAASRWLDRAARPWQLHWHFSRDMAYAGLGAPKREVAVREVAATRGRILRSGGQPILALFSAASGGRSEAAANLFPGIAGAATMRTVDDPASAAGARGLRLDGTHLEWSARLTLAELTSALQGWSREERGRPRIGSVTAIRIGSRHGDSGRVAEVEVSHRLDGRRTTTAIPGGEFRMAVGPGEVRSTWWTRIDALRDGAQIRGRGFGHGVGLSQVGAWQMARDGRSAERIVAEYFPGAELVAAY